MHALIENKLSGLQQLCRTFGVARLEIFGSARRGADFDADASDADVLVVFASPDADLIRLLDLHDALESLLGRPVDLVDRRTIEANRNYIRRRSILNEAELIYAA